MTNEDLNQNLDGSLWEEVPTEDLWEDGEISRFRCMIKIFKNVVEQGNWKVVRKRKCDDDIIEWYYNDITSKDKK